MVIVSNGFSVHCACCMNPKFSLKGQDAATAITAEMTNSISLASMASQSNLEACLMQSLLCLLKGSILGHDEVVRFDVLALIYPPLGTVNKHFSYICMLLSSNNILSNRRSYLEDIQHFCTCTYPQLVEEQQLHYREMLRHQFSQTHIICSTVSSMKSIEMNTCIICLCST